MTEYDCSPEAYDRYLATQNRIANWVEKTEQHRSEFQSANKGPQDLTRSGPRASPSPSRQHSGQSQPRQLAIHPPPPESVSSSSDSYYEAAPMHRLSPGMVLPQKQQPLSSPPPMMTPIFVTSPHRSSHHHRHRSHDHGRSHSHHSPAYYPVASPPSSPAYQHTAYPGVNQGYAMMPQYGTQIPSSSPRSVPAAALQPTSYFQPQHSSAFLASNSQPSSPQSAWPTYGAPSPGYPMMSTPTGSPLHSPAFPRIPTYQSFAMQQPSPLTYRIPHKRVYDLRTADG